MITKPKTAVLMLSWLRFEVLLSTLRQLPKTCSEPLHLILRVQGREELTKDDIAKVHEAASGFTTTDIYFTPYNVGAAAARLDLTHRGTKTGYKYLLFTDDDIKFIKDGIDKQVEILDTYPNIGAASLRPDNKRYLRIISGDSVSSVDRIGLQDLFYKVFLVGSAALMMRSDLYKTHLVAPDPEFYIGSWDYDLCLQIQQTGYDLVELPNYIIRNKRGGCERYKQKRHRKEYIRHNRKVSVKKWGFDLATINSRIIKNEKMKIPEFKSKGW